MMRFFPLVIVVAATAFSAAVFNRLPSSMAIHWGATGEPDDYGSRAFGAFVFPAVMLVLWAILAALPAIDPRRANIEKFRDSYDTLVIAIVAVMGVLHVGIIGAALGWPVSIARLAPISIGLLLVMVGVLLPGFRSNFFIGIRTPWTLTSETVWARTHRVGGYMMVGVGLLLITAGAIGTTIWLRVAIAGALVLVVGAFVYSWWAWRDENRRS